MMRMKPKITHFNGQSQLSTGNAVDNHVTHFEKPVAYDFNILFQQSWMNKTHTGSQEVQHFWQTEANFQHKKTLCASSVSTIQLIFFQFISFLFQKVSLRFRADRCTKNDEIIFCWCFDSRQVFWIKIR